MAESFDALGKNSPVFEIARILVRFNHLASFIVNTNHGTVRVLKPIVLKKEALTKMEILGRMRV